jgi:hypothetical protein
LTTARHHLAGHGAAGGDGLAQIALQRTPDPAGNCSGSGEAVQLAHLRLQFGRGIGRQHRDQRIAGRHVHQRKAQQGHAQHDGRV